MKLGVVGAGSWGTKVIKEYLDLQKEHIIDDLSICERRDDLLKKYAAQPQIKTYRDYKPFLEGKSVDAIHVCLPNMLHYDVAKTAIENDIHVLMEKPMTQNSLEAYKLVELASEKGIILEVGHIYRFANIIRKLKTMMGEKTFGDIHYMTFKWTSTLNEAQAATLQDVDIVWDLMPHILDIINFLVDQWPMETFVYKKRRQISFLNLCYEDFIVNVELSWVTHERKRELRIIGSERSAKVECVKQQMHLFEKEKEMDIPVEANNTIRDETLNFIESIKNKKMMYNSHIIGARNVSVIEKILSGNQMT